MAHIASSSPRTDDDGERSLCDGLSGAYSVWFHVLAVIIILAASILGTALPLLSKYVPSLSSNPFYFAVGKTAATGVLLSVSCIHLINEAGRAFQEWCVPAFFKSYNAYAFLFALTATLMMQALDMQLAVIAERWLCARRRESQLYSATVSQDVLIETLHDNRSNHHRYGKANGNANPNGVDHMRREEEDEMDGHAVIPVHAVVLCDADCNAEDCALLSLKEQLRNGDAAGSCFDPRLSAKNNTHSLCAEQRNKSPADAVAETQSVTPEASHTRNSAHDTSTPSESAPLNTLRRSTARHATHTNPVHAAQGATATPAARQNHDACTSSHSHHEHGIVLPPEEMGVVRRTIAAVCMEFGVTLHSVFVGLAVGVTTNAELGPLLVALVFHQMFEGMAMGARLADAQFNYWLEVSLAGVFAISAPAGMAIGIVAAVTSPSSMSGSGFVVMLAVLDSFCGGILLYLAFNLLLFDFVEDVKTYSADGLPHRRRRKCTLFAALWAGMLLMAAVGKWL